MKPLYLFVALSVILAACSSAPQANSVQNQNKNAGITKTQPAPSANYAGEVNSPSSQSSTGEGQSAAVEDLVRVDEQGMIVVEVTPVNLNAPGESLEFEVGLNTHSVDLSMDLAQLATLTTDSGKSVQASQWDAPSGGHHVSGKLVFPTTVDGQPLLEGAKKLTLTIQNLDAPERVFSWDLKS